MELGKDADLSTRPDAVRGPVYCASAGQQAIRLSGIQGTTMDANLQVDGIRDILTWSQGCPDWQRDALRRLCAGPDLVESDETELLAIMKGARNADRLADQHIRQPTKASQAVVLKSIRNAENVNALAEKQTLSFCEKGVTIIYGDNGSGKSGYARILKSACRARLERGFDIRPDIYGTKQGQPQTASISYLDRTNTRAHQWTKGQASTPELSAIGVFDAAAASIHVTGTNEIAYTPFPLLVLGRLARAADNLKLKLNAEIQQLESQIPPSVVNHQCSKETAPGKLLSNLSGKTKPESLSALATLTDSEKAELQALKRDFADDPTAIATRNLQLAQRLESLSATIAGVAAALNEGPLQAILLLKTVISTKSEAARLDAERRFAGDPMIAGTALWQQLWEAARAYGETEGHVGEAFPKTDEDALCILCQQPLDEVAADRLARFEAFVVDELGKQIKAAQGELHQAINFAGVEYLQIRRIADIRDYLDRAGEPILAQSIGRFLIQAAWRRRWLTRAQGTEPITAAPPIYDAPIRIISTTVENLKAKARALQGAATSPERRALKNRLDELSDREWISVVKDDVLRAIRIFHGIERLKALLPQTARAKITVESTRLAKLLVTDRLRDRFAAEVSELGIHRLRVELKQERSEAGQPRFKVCFVAKPSENVGLVLSEGETRCLAIAAFLAELETAAGVSGIVLDDPISSLDHFFRQKVAARLASEAKQRQVIVFTHDIPFLAQLQQACKDAHTEQLTRLVSRGGDRPGFCFDEAPATHRPVEDAIESLRRNLANKRRIYDLGDTPKWAECVIGFGGTLRQLWERAVEDVVSPVLTRWTHKVNTPGFIQLTAITPADHQTMRQGFGQCSIWEHYQPAAGNIPLPSADEIIAEVENLAQWHAAVTARQKPLK